MDSTTSASHRTQTAATKIEPWDVVITGKKVAYVSVVCFIAWVGSVYDHTLFGTGRLWIFRTVVPMTLPWIKSRGLATF